MKISKDIIKTEGIRLSIQENDQELARATLYLMTNSLHKRPFGLMEDVFVTENLRGQGIGTKLVNEIIDEAKARGCYKLIATSRYSRPKVHELYLQLGFKDHGKEFRVDFE